MPANPRVLRRRLTPQVRREQILGEAAAIILAEGVSAVTMERLGREAGVSKALVYAYFEDRLDLLTALLLREHARFRQEGRRLLAEVEGFENKVRATTAAWLDHVADNGALIERLLNEPDIACVMETTAAAGRPEMTSYFGDLIAREYGISRHSAVTLADLLMGLTGAAGEHIRRTGCDRQPVLELSLQMIFAALGGVAEYEAAKAPPKDHEARAKHS